MGLFYFMNRDFKGVWIPKDVWLDHNLSWMEKLLLVEIDSLDAEKGCFASNGYFGEFFNLSPSRISEMVSSLVSKLLLYELTVIMFYLIDYYILNDIILTLPLKCRPPLHTPLVQWSMPPF